MRERVALVVAVVIAGGALGLGGWLVLGRGSPDPQAAAEAAVTTYLEAWEEGDWTELREQVHEPPPDFVDWHADTWEALEVTDTALDAGTVVLNRAQATTELAVSLELAGAGTWDYRTELTLLRRDGEWGVTWSPATLHPELKDGLAFARREVEPERAPILAHDGTSLTVPGELQVIGVEPRRIEDAETVVAAFAEHTPASAEEVERLLARDDLVPTWFYPVVTMRPERYDAVRSELVQLPGLVFRTTTGRVTPEEDFAAHVLGRTGEITAELLDELGEPYEVGDTVGLSGLERVFEERLAGAPSAEIVLVDGRDEDADVVRTVERFGGREPEPVTVTLDVELQRAVEQALDGVARPAAVVAIDPASGAIRGAASRPLDEFNRALAGLYPPGSTFKIVTAYAALRTRVSADTVLACPASTVVGGLEISNADDRDLGEISFRRAFAESCNTTFANLAADLPGAALREAASSFGFGAGYDLPLTNAGGRFPEPADVAERAAAAIGQGRVQVSPLHLASVAAAAADGTWRAPRLLADASSGEVRDLEPGALSVLRDLLREVVVDGTGTAADLPGVHGKTGSAEVEAGGPTHAWFAGYRDELAFAVLVEEGGSGGEVAAPIARRLLEAAGSGGSGDAAGDGDDT